MKTEKLSKREFRRRFGKELGCTQYLEGEEPTIYLPGGGSTKIRLHEIYHASLSPELEKTVKEWNDPTADEWALEELRACDFSRKKIGKEELSFNYVRGVAQGMLDRGYNPAVIMGSIVRGLEELDFEPMDRDTRSYLWREMRNYRKDTEEVEDSG